jgi:hypothetical protein
MSFAEILPLAFVMIAGRQSFLALDLAHSRARARCDSSQSF